VAAQASRAADADVAPGREFDVVVTLAIKGGWHLDANPVGVANLKPTTVVLAPDQPASLVRVDYPPGRLKVLASSGAERVSLYEGEVAIAARVRLDPGIKAVPETLTFRVQYQACNDRACLAPATLTVPVRLTGDH
jgi:DsbC/DsbD-like thiol-disulfide interchange protein